ncbi:hypothetical protein BdWA1_000510 [Babesia duncani]|uniref:Uncharacterized protein n=1 Tax=Babesia duncani TaxID=323732 RepID=A0AAD9PMK8_9APIC|nr:hypothetical protein BdWA1_000510 [Babesia duncani]
MVLLIKSQRPTLTINDARAHSHGAKILNNCRPWLLDKIGMFHSRWSLGAAAMKPQIVTFGNNTEPHKVEPFAINDSLESLLYSFVKKNLVHYSKGIIYYSHDVWNLNPYNACMKLASNLNLSNDELKAMSILIGLMGAACSNPSGGNNRLDGKRFKAKALEHFEASIVANRKSPDDPTVKNRLTRWINRLEENCDESKTLQMVLQGLSQRQLHGDCDYSDKIPRGPVVWKMHDANVDNQINITPHGCMFTMSIEESGVNLGFTVERNIELLQPQCFGIRLAGAVDVIRGRYGV